MARLARGHTHEGFVFLFCRIRSGLTVAALYIFDQPLKSHIVHTDAALTAVMHLDGFSVRSVNQDIVDFFRIFTERSGKGKIVLLCQRIENGSRIARFVRAGLPAEHGDGSVCDGYGLVRNHQILVELHLVAKAGTARAGAERVVEGKASRLNLLHADAAVRAGKALAEVELISVHRVDHQKAVRQIQYILDGIRQTFLNVRFDYKTVHNNGNVVFQVLIQRNLLGQLILAAVDHHADIAAAFCLFEHLFVSSLAAAHNRREKLDFRPLRECHDLIDHLVHRLAADDFSALRAVRNTDSRVQKTEVIVNLRHGSDGGTRVPVRRFLIDRNSRRQTFDAVHIRFFHLS